MAVGKSNITFTGSKKALRGKCFQLEDKVFKLSQTERNAGGFAVLRPDRRTTVRRGAKTVKANNSGHFARCYLVVRFAFSVIFYSVTN